MLLGNAAQVFYFHFIYFSFTFISFTFDIISVLWITHTVYEMCLAHFLFVLNAFCQSAHVTLALWQLNAVNTDHRISMSSQTRPKISIKYTGDSSKLFVNVSLQQKWSQRWLFSDQPLSITSSDIPWGNAQQTINLTCPLSSELETHYIILKAGFVFDFISCNFMILIYFLFIIFLTNRKWAKHMIYVLFTTRQSDESSHGATLSEHFLSDNDIF